MDEYDCKIDVVSNMDIHARLSEDNASQRSCGVSHSGENLEYRK